MPLKRAGSIPAPGTLNEINGFLEHKRLHEIFEVSRSPLYYKSKKYEEDLNLKMSIEKVWSDHPSYGHKRLDTALGHILRVMKKVNIKPNRIHRKPFKRTNTSV